MWINPRTKQVFTLHAEIRAALPSFSFPAEMTAGDIEFAGLVPVQPAEPPEHDTGTHQAVPAAPALVDGVWLQQWAVENKPPQPVPQSVTPAQGLVALFALKGITEADLYAAIDQIADPVQQYTARIGVTRTTEWRRDSVTMQAMAALLGLGGAGLDALFVYAAEVQI